MDFGNDTIQAGLIAKAKSITAITSLVTNSESIVEIREAEWQGVDFEYPAIRLRLRPTQVPIEDCGPVRIQFVWEVYSEQASSKESMDIATAIISNFPKSWTYTDSGGQEYLFNGIKTSLIDRPFRIGQRTWQENVEMAGFIR